MFVIVPMFIPTGGWNLLKTDGMRGSVVGFFSDEGLADRVCVLLNRFGEADSEIPPEMRTAFG